ncbi:MAG TPA: HIT family protein [Caulobacteraceae bacterium]|jgi:diadenosine tetraphosphate (Ap4A) HIT family hydrolase
MFELDPAFLATSRGLMALPLCEARLQLDARFAWIVLAPRVDAATELEDLDAYARRRLMDEILAAGRAVRAIGDALGRPVQKLNVGQLGNITRQLHVHVVGRRTDDTCWPGPVWGQGVAEPYAPAALERAMAAAIAALSSAAV